METSCCRFANVESWFDLSWIDQHGHRLMDLLGGEYALAVFSSGASFIGALITVWVMQRTTSYTNWGARSDKAIRARRVFWIQRIMLGVVAVSFALNAMTPFITPDPPWLAYLPIVVSTSLVLLIYAIWYRPIIDD